MPKLAEPRLHSAGRVAINHPSELVRALATLLGVRDQPLESLPSNEDAAAFTHAAPESDPAWQIEKRIFLQRLWTELRELPPNQRAARAKEFGIVNGRPILIMCFYAPRATEL